MRRRGVAVPLVIVVVVIIVGGGMAGLIAACGQSPPLRAGSSGATHGTAA